MTAAKEKEAKTREKGVEWARKKAEALFENSEIVDKTGELPKFDLAEVELGKVLGKGGFGTVSEVMAFKVSGVSQANKFKSRHNVMAGHENDAEAEDGAENRNFIAQHCVRTSGDARYALKILSPEVVKDIQTFLQGVIDMAVESRFLGDIEHPNIIKIRALAKCVPYDEKYFIVMDRLYDTLEHRIKKWGKRLKRESGFLRDRSGEKAKDLYEERVVVAFDLAAAIEYLHQRHILYRDIKPENIGFDIRDDVKVFDFGLAKELKESLRNDDGTYKLTEMTGSPRYMAPEVGLGKPYNHTCDTYSFAILLWEMMACKAPFTEYNLRLVRERVWGGTFRRPPMDEGWPVPIKLLIKRSWDNDLHQRNSMESVCQILRKECVRARDGDDSGLEHARRRSTFVFRPKAGQAGGLRSSSKSSKSGGRPALAGINEIEEQ